MIYDSLPYDENRWFSPKYAINYFWDILKDIGDIALKSDKYKKHREAWIMGVMLLGVMKGTQRIWWLQVPKEDPPDMMVMKIEKDEEKESNMFQCRKMEIMQVTKFTNDEIQNEIKRKLDKMYYEGKTGLVVYVNRDTGKLNLKELSDKISAMDLRIADIWLLLSTSQSRKCQ